MAARDLNSIDDFLNHSGYERGGAHLGNWRTGRGATGKVEVWLHTKRMPVVLWQHGFTRLVPMEDRQTRENVTRVWSDKLVCWEEEDVLLKRNRRNPDGTRECPPVACPMCILGEVLRELVAAGKLGFTQPIFTFQGDKAEEDVTIHAGGFTGEFGRDDLPIDRAREMQAARIKASEAWKESAAPKMAYLFTVVNNQAPERGIQVTTETGLLGDKTKEVIQKTRKSLGAERGNYSQYPYCILWEYLEDQKVFNKKYDASRLELVPMTPEVEKLIRGPTPDISRQTAPFNRDKLRAAMEQFATPEARAVIPWDRVFAGTAPKEMAVADEDFPYGANSPAEERPAQAQVPANIAPAPVPRTGPTTPFYPPNDPAREAAQVAKLRARGVKDEDMVECDQCGGVIAESDPKCEWCGKVYAALPPSPPPPQRRTRGEVAAVPRQPPPALGPQPGKDPSGIGFSDWGSVSSVPGGMKCPGYGQ